LTKLFEAFIILSPKSLPYSWKLSPEVNVEMDDFLSLIPRDHQPFLSLAALFEEDFSIDWIAELIKVKPSQLFSALDLGVEKGWLAKRRAGFFYFQDLKEKQNFQNLVPQEQKDELFGQIASLLLNELPQDDYKALVLAPYLLRLHNDVETCRWLVRAGDIHRRAFNNEKALQCYGKVLDDLAGVSGEESDLVYCDAAIKYSKISTARHDTKKILFIIKEAMVRVERWSQKGTQALLHMHLAKNEWLGFRYAKALRSFEKGWSLAKKLNDPKVMRSASIFGTFFLYWQGRYREAVLSYEKSVPDVEKYPQRGFPLIAALMVAHCYQQIGQVTQGLGMMDAIRNHSREQGDLYTASQAGVTMGTALLDIRRINDALQCLECSLEEARAAHNNWAWIPGKLMLAFAYYLREDNKRSLIQLREFSHYCQQVHVTVPHLPYLMELYWAMEQGKLPSISGFSLEKEIQRMIRGKNIFMKGVAYRYQALLEKRMGLPSEKVKQSLDFSLGWLEESGNKFELAASKFELARLYLSKGMNENAQEITLMASNLLSPFNEALIPDDLKPLIKDTPAAPNLLKEILKLGQEVVSIWDNKDLVQLIISTVNRITGAERGAIFILEETSHPPRLNIKASKNLTFDEIKKPDFSPSMRMIEKVALTGKGIILGANPSENINLSQEMIRSRICVPMTLKDKIVGVLYHDNRLLDSAFRESDLELLAYFAGLAAIALENARNYERIQELTLKLREEKTYYEEQHLENINFGDIVGESKGILRVLAQVDQVAGADTGVLIMGETGVGKELVAREIHRRSPRRDKPFIRVLCSALPDSLIPSELFGHERGAFTGAIHQRIGRFELADGGTLFLDEIGDLPQEVQTRLLRVLETKEFERVGGNKTIHSDFRLLAATNRNIGEEVNTHRFRADLYYRLNVFPIYVPPLRERKEDIPLLAHFFLKIYSAKLGKSYEKFPQEELNKLIKYDWPGNIRELENIIERSVILNAGPIFRIPQFGPGDQELGQAKFEITLKENERRHILWALQKVGWKVRGRGGAAELLNIHPSTLAFRMKKLGIQRQPEFSRRRSETEKEFRQGTNSLH
jgi:formate hydrogenlyase transcriptional activator